MTSHHGPDDVQPSLPHDAREDRPQTPGGLKAAINASLLGLQELATALTLPGVITREEELAARLKSSADRLTSLFADLKDLPPSSDRSVDAAIEPGHAEGGMPSRQRILIVEDFGPSILLLTSQLHKLGYDYDIAQNGMEALKKFAEGHYDIVLMDIQMPEMGGLETTRKIRALEKENGRPQTPIVAASGTPNGNDRHMCLTAGMNDFLAKPFVLKDLESKLQQFKPLRTSAQLSA